MMMLRIDHSSSDSCTITTIVDDHHDATIITSKTATKVKQQFTNDNDYDVVERAEYQGQQQSHYRPDSDKDDGTVTNVATTTMASDDVDGDIDRWYDNNNNNNNNNNDRYDNHRCPYQPMEWIVPTIIVALIVLDIIIFSLCWGTTTTSGHCVHYHT